MATKSRKSRTLAYPKAEFLIARYSALMEERQNHNSNNYQIISLHLIISSTILTFGLQPSSAASVLFIIPILNMLMAIVAVYNFLARRRQEMIIKSDIEAEFDFVSKDTAFQKRFIPRFIGLVGAGGLFVIVQILALVLGLLKIQHYTTLDMVLIISDILALLIVIWSIGIVSRAIKEESPAQKAG